MLYAPQFRRWPDFERIEAWSAIKVRSPDGKTVHYGTLALSGDTDIDMDAQTVTITNRRSTTRCSSETCRRPRWMR